MPAPPGVGRTVLRDEGAPQFSRSHTSLRPEGRVINFAPAPLPDRFSGAPPRKAQGHRRQQFQRNKLLQPPQSVVSSRWGLLRKRTYLPLRDGEPSNAACRGFSIVNPSREILLAHSLQERNRLCLKTHRFYRRLRISQPKYLYHF